MTTDNKTLADVQPGGRVRLGGSNSLAERITDHLCNNEYDIGGRAELLSCVSEAIAADARERFEAWARLRGHTLTRAADGEYCFINVRNLWTQWQAALSAQPSPGGQGDALLREVSAQLESLDCGACIGSDAPMEDLHGRIAAHLAARQPVGEPVGRVSYYSPMNFGGFMIQFTSPTKIEPGTPLYDAPTAQRPAQAVDVGQLWVSVNDRLPSEEDYGESGDVVVRYRYNTPNSVQGSWDVGESRHDADDIEWNNGWLFGSCDYAEVSHWMPKNALLALTESQAVGNG